MLFSKNQEVLVLPEYFNNKEQIFLVEFNNKGNVAFITSKTNDTTDVLKYGEDYLIYPSGNKVKYLFDDNDQLVGINFNDQVVVKNMVSNGGGDFKSFEYGNGIKVKKKFKGLNLKESEHKGLYEETVSIYDGRIKNISYKSKDLKKADKYKFSYDDKNQIDKIIIDKYKEERLELEQKYDDNQNILSTFKGETLEYKESSNQLSDKERFDYDLSGNMTKLDNLTIIYNYKNHIEQVLKDGEVIAEYDYNLLNQRSKAFYPKENITKHFYYDFMGRMIEEKIADDSPPYNKLLKAMVLSIKKGDAVSL